MSKTARHDDKTGGGGPESPPPPDVPIDDVDNDGTAKGPWPKSASIKKHPKREDGNDGGCFGGNHPPDDTDDTPPKPEEPKPKPPVDY